MIGRPRAIRTISNLDSINEFILDLYEMEINIYAEPSKKFNGFRF
jgi:hypothetical protein